MANPHLPVMSLGFELSAFSALLGVEGGTVALLAFGGLHLMASLVTVLFVYPLMPAPYRVPRLATLAYLFCFALFIPLLGIVGLVGGMLYMIYLRHPQANQNFATVQLPDIRLVSHNQNNAQYGLGGIRARLEDRTASLESRLRALIAVQSMPARFSNSLLRKLLIDPVDDIRLIAYGMLDGQEKTINAKIHEELQVLADPAITDVVRLRAVHHLGELYWELAYQGLVQGDLRKHALTEASRFVSQGLELMPSDAALWVLEARIIAELGHIELAEDAFRHAIELGYPRARLAPFQAEIAYRRRQFDQVRDLLSQPGVLHQSGAMRDLAHYWQTKTPAETAPAARISISKEPPPVMDMARTDTPPEPDPAIAPRDDSAPRPPEFPA